MKVLSTMINILYAEYKYLIYKYILFTRQLVDNMKSFGAQIKNENIETIIKEYEKKKTRVNS